MKNITTLYKEFSEEMDKELNTFNKLRNHFIKDSRDSNIPVQDVEDMFGFMLEQYYSIKQVADIHITHGKILQKIIKEQEKLLKEIRDAEDK